MIARLPLIRRITLAFVLLTIVISGLFSLGVVVVVHYIEAQLVSEELNQELDAIIHDALELERTPETEPNTLFFASNLPGFEIPHQFVGLTPGFNEIVNGDKALYVFSRIHHGNTYMLVEDQSDFEAREDMLYLVVFTGFVISVLLAWVFGRLVARHAIAPVIRLAQQVSNRDQMIPVAHLLAAEYSNDEVGNLAAAFDKALGQLRSSLEREYLFTSDISHELRTPLMVIASSCELLLESPAIDGSQRRQIERIARACQDMRDLAETMLMLARENHKLPVQGNRITLHQAANELYQHWHDQFADKGLAFSLEEEQRDDRRYHATFLKTVMANLLRNALHYTEQGEVRLMLDAGGFSVHDTGMGVAPDQQESIFRPFIRGRQAGGEGYGLGLSLVHRICEHQGWRVSVEPVSSGGSIFRMRLADAA